MCDSSINLFCLLHECRFDSYLSVHMPIPNSAVHKNMDTFKFKSKACALLSYILLFRKFTKSYLLGDRMSSYKLVGMNSVIFGNKPVKIVKIIRG